jgi:hypothetical protein
MALADEDGVKVDRGELTDGVGPALELLEGMSPKPFVNIAVTIAPMIAAETAATMAYLPPIRAALTESLSRSEGLPASFVLGSLACWVALSPTATLVPDTGALKM